jgi:hypothetical protein
MYRAVAATTAVAIGHRGSAAVLNQTDSLIRVTHRS